MVGKQWLHQCKVSDADTIASCMYFSADLQMIWQSRWTLQLGQLAAQLEHFPKLPAIPTACIE